MTNPVNPLTLERVERLQEARPLQPLHNGCTVAEWLELWLPNKEVVGSTPGSDHINISQSLWVEFACSPRVTVGFLWAPPPFSSSAAADRRSQRRRSTSFTFYQVVQTLEDHHQEVLSLYRDFGFAGLIAQDSEFALCNVPAYFSSHALKLSWNGKNLTTHQYLLSEAARQLGLKTHHLPCFAALLGNHILPDEDLAAFHWSLLGPEHPLASLKVRAHQLVLPPCEVVIKAVSEYVSSIKDLSNLDAIAKDVFKQAQSRMEDKIERFKKAVEYFSAASKPRSQNLGPSAFVLPGFGPPPFGPPGPMGPMQPGKNQRLVGSVRFFSGRQSVTQSPHRTTVWPSPSPSSSSDGDEPNDNNSNHLTDKSSRWEEPSGKGGSGDASSGNGGSNIPSLLSMATRSHMDITTPPLPQVSAEVLRVAEHRHRRGLMYPQIYHILTKGEMKMPVCIEDECNAELPPASLLFRAARQYAYGVLFSLAETHRRLERLALRKRAPLEAGPGSVLQRVDLSKPEATVAGTSLRGSIQENQGLFSLSALRLPRPPQPRQVPQHLLLMCCVLRYMMQWPGGRILQRHELDAFLAQAVSSQLYEPDQLQELKVEKVDARGVQLASLFMAGVDTALFINDVCGQPLPWEHCCPWGFFDGKLFQSKLSRASRDRAALLDMCEGQEELVSKVEKMRQAILEGINLSRPPPPPPPLPLQPSSLPPWCLPSTPSLPCTRLGPWACPPTTTRTTHTTRPSTDPEPSQVRLIHSQNSRLIFILFAVRSSDYPPALTLLLLSLSGLQSIPPQGGKLEIAGMVVGQWAGNKPVRGRGGFNMQVVSVGAGRGRGKEIPAKMRGGKKATANRPQSSPPSSPQEEAGSVPDVMSQLNGSSAAAIGQNLDLAPLAQPIPCALASRDNQSEEAACCLEDCASDGALQKEE
ncbi:hypothetical protein WMY93_027237 [Mugilogobius chulae]|uniref:Family with sequence similarity 120C n=1 Tax=Mugilogobius chulae TaxID=88201 RepID=A0AAW0MZ51_9GOBI